MLARIMGMLQAPLSVSSVAPFLHRLRGAPRRHGHELHSCIVTAQSTGDARAVAVGVVLAGGEARRMGRDKRLLRLAGVTLLERNLAFLDGLFPCLLYTSPSPR